MLCNWNLVKEQGESSETPTAEAVQAALLGHGKERIPGGHQTASQKVRGFIEKMDLGSLLRCSVEEKGHKLKKNLQNQTDFKENNFHYGDKLRDKLPGVLEGFQDGANPRGL